MRVKLPGESVPIYLDTVSIDVQVPILQPVPHWQVLLGKIAIRIVLSPKRDFQFLFKGISPLNKHLLLCETSLTGEALSPRNSFV